MVTLPVRVNAHWIATLQNDQLRDAEEQLHAEFIKEESIERSRAGARYSMMRGPESLTAAWLRWLLVNNEVFARGVAVQRHTKRRS